MGNEARSNSASRTKRRASAVGIFVVIFLIWLHDMRTSLICTSSFRENGFVAKALFAALPTDADLSVDASVLPIWPPVAMVDEHDFLRTIPVVGKASREFTTTNIHHLSTTDNFSRREYQKAEAVQCNVPCHYSWAPGPNNPHTVSSGRILGTNGPLVYDYTVESVVNYPYFSLSAIHRRGNIAMTYDLDGDVPVTYLEFWKDVPMQEPPRYEDTIKAVSVVISNCLPLRQRFLRALASRGVPIVSMGRCLPNVNQTARSKLPRDKLKLIRPYALHLAMENTLAKHYVTEKLFQPVLAGTVPVYYGPPGAAGMLPSGDAMIDVRAFDSLDALAVHLRHVLLNKSAWESYHAWRRRPPSPQYLALGPKVATDFRCRLCRLAYAKRKGLAWNQTAQTFAPAGQSVPPGERGAAPRPLRRMSEYARLDVWS